MGESRVFVHFYEFQPFYNLCQSIRSWKNIGKGSISWYDGQTRHMANPGSTGVRLQQNKLKDKLFNIKNIYLSFNLYIIKNKSFFFHNIP